MDNKSKIMKVALELFAAGGYDAVGVQEIVLRAEVTKPTLYHYFGNKLGLLDTILKENIAPLLTGLGKNVYSGDLPLILFRLVRVYFDFAAANRAFYRMQLSLMFAPENNEVVKVVSPLYEKQLEFFENLFLAASVDHGNMKGRHKIYAATFLGMINTYIGLYLNGQIVPDEECIYKAVHQFMHGIYS